MYRMSVLVRGLAKCRRGRQTRRLERWHIQRSMNIPLRLTHRYQVAGWQGPAMRRRASGRLKSRPFILLCKPLAGWPGTSTSSTKLIAIVGYGHPWTSSTKLIVAAGSVPFHGPVPSTCVSHFSSTNSHVEIHLHHVAPLRVNDSSPTAICVRRRTSARSTTALPSWFVASSVDDHGTLVSGMCRARPRGVSLSNQRPLVG